MPMTREQLVARFLELGMAPERAQEAATVTVRGYGCIAPGPGGRALLAALAARGLPASTAPTDLSFWNEAKHPRAPKGTHLGGEWWKAGSLGSSKKKTHDDLRGLLTGRDGLNDKADWDKPRTGDGVMREQKAPAVRAAERAAARAKKAGGSSTGPRSRPGGLNDKATWDASPHKPSKPTPTGKAGTTRAPRVPGSNGPHELSSADMGRPEFAKKFRAQLDAELPKKGEKVGAVRTKNGTFWAKAAASAALTASLMGAIGGAGGESVGYSDQGSPDFYGGTSVSSMKGHHDDAPPGPNLLPRSTMSAGLSWTTSERR